MPLGTGGRGYVGGRGQPGGRAQVCNDITGGCGGVEVTLVSRGSDPDRCPDPFRCSEPASDWLLQNQDRKQQLEDLRETTSQLQEGLEKETQRVNTLTQSTRLAERRRRLGEVEEQQEEVQVLLSIHSVLLQQLQMELLLLSSSLRRTKRTPGCTINILQSGGSLSLRDALHPGGGWTLVQRRRDGALSFNRNWTTYREGFGLPEAEHWLGNEVIHTLTNQGHYSLRIHLEDWKNTHKHAVYSSFSLDGEGERYRLHVSGFSGSVSDSFGWYHDNQVFSTPDTGNICSEISHSGWWFNQCFHANLNGVYYKAWDGYCRTKLLQQPLIQPIKMLVAVKDGPVSTLQQETEYCSVIGHSTLFVPHDTGGMAFHGAFIPVIIPLTVIIITTIILTPSC
ncbi:hypothetical protein CRUP_006102 [Coryphaenoides rupestris]|nr:hypothetical protein CRUP_006102 [Coryphaenoides rupestris]